MSIGFCLCGPLCTLIFFVPVPIVRNRRGRGVGGVSDFRGGTKGREFWEIIGKRVAGSIFELEREKMLYKII
jgi:hypothetical protein